jgi:hypothetical protein
MGDIVVKIKEIATRILISISSVCRDMFSLPEMQSKIWHIRGQNEDRPFEVESLLAYGGQEIQIVNTDRDEHS